MKGDNYRTHCDCVEAGLTLAPAYARGATHPPISALQLQLHKPSAATRHFAGRPLLVFNPRETPD